MKLNFSFLLIASLILFSCGKKNQIEGEWKVDDVEIIMDTTNGCEKSLILRDSLYNLLYNFLEENYHNSIYSFKSDVVTKTKSHSDPITGHFELSYFTEEMNYLAQEKTGLKENNFLEIQFADDEKSDQSWYYEFRQDGSLKFKSQNQTSFEFDIDKYIYPARECYTIELHLTEIE